MPTYTYHCESCGTFTLRQRMSEQHETATCPDCEAIAKREFQPFQTYRLDQRVKQRIEKGQQPRIVKGKDLPKKAAKPQNTSRPWMTGH
ncbi:FmdB family zinc ribbon protein [Staphylococcus canis]|uniref:Zinc ribbon domain-containing protein n=1 Tax=Staphylococcus canis TaxID=2724942 RepID=A0ABS0T656_9STAP|nr:zinc ribbon domain-containing protein [Staphylococcus canis]MBI5974157.1 zinc ribbon domain-containing protein [Staphylococcus canis]